MDNFLSGVSSKHASDEYSPQYDLQSAVESRLQEKNNFENSDENQLQQKSDKPINFNKPKVWRHFMNVAATCLIE